MAALSVFHSRFFTRRTSSQKELRSSRAAKDSPLKSTNRNGRCHPELIEGSPFNK
jgi:hypothetical protein